MSNRRKKSTKKCSTPSQQSITSSSTNDNKNENSTITSKRLSQAIVSFCSASNRNEEQGSSSKNSIGIVEFLSLEEAEGIADLIVGDSHTTSTFDGNNEMEDENYHVFTNESISILQDYLGVTMEQAQYILEQASSNIHDDDVHHDDYESDNDNESNCSFLSDSDSDEESYYIQEGECELCEREIKLTKHHLIPKSTWKSVKNRFLSAKSFYDEGDMKAVVDILGLGDEILSYISKKDFSSGLSIKLFLANYTADLCRACHSCIHSTFSNIELAEGYNSVEKLLQDHRIFNFCRWANKQKSGIKLTRIVKK